MRKIMLIGLAVLLIPSCTKCEVLSPINGEVTVVLLNVYVTFDYDVPQLITFNENFGGAEVIVTRKVDDSWVDYTEIFNRHIPGRTGITEEAYFKTGDKIELYIRIDNEDEDDPERWNYFQLGKRALAAEIFPDEQPEQFEFYQNDDGSVTLVFTY